MSYLVKGEVCFTPDKKLLIDGWNPLNPLKKRNLEADIAMKRVEESTPTLET